MKQQPSERGSPEHGSPERGSPKDRMAQPGARVSVSQGEPLPRLRMPGPRFWLIAAAVVVAAAAAVTAAVAFSRLIRPQRPDETFSAPKGMRVVDFSAIRGDGYTLCGLEPLIGDKLLLAFSTELSGARRCDYDVYDIKSGRFEPFAAASQEPRSTLFTGFASLPDGALFAALSDGRDTFACSLDQNLTEADRFRLPDALTMKICPSPDGRTIAYTSPNGIAAADCATGSIRSLLTSPSDENGAHVTDYVTGWLPDGSGVVFTEVRFDTQTSAGRYLFTAILSVRDSGVRRLAGLEGYGAQPGAPGYLVYYDKSGQRAGLYDLATGGKSPLGPESLTGEPCVAPGGAYLACETAGTQEESLCLVSLKTGRIVASVSPMEGVCCGCFTADGGFYAYTLGASGGNPAPDRLYLFGLK